MYAKNEHTKNVLQLPENLLLTHKYKSRILIWLSWFRQPFILWQIQEALCYWAGFNLYDCYRPQRSCGKVMFLHLSVILSTGWVSAIPSGQTPPWAHPPGTHTLGTHSPGKQPPAQCMLGYTTTLPSACWDTPPCPVHAGIRSTSGRYASYWNAFLFYKWTLIRLKVSHFHKTSRKRTICQCIQKPLRTFPWTSTTFFVCMNFLLLLSPNRN